MNRARQEALPYALSRERIGTRRRAFEQRGITFCYGLELRNERIRAGQRW